MIFGHVRAWARTFNDGHAVASMDLSTEYEGFCSARGDEIRCKWDEGGNQKGAGMIPAP